MQGLGAFLQAEGLSELGPTLFEKITLSEMQSLLASNRPKFLTKLKELGIVRLGERQKLANALTKAEKDGRLTASRPIRQLIPPCYRENEDGTTITVRLQLPPAVRSTQITFTCDVNSLKVSILGEHSACCGTLCGIIKPADSTWEIERAQCADYDPLLSASEQPEASPDALVVTLHKAKPGGWQTLFKDAVASRVHVPTAQEKARAERERLAECNRQSKADERKRNLELGVTPAPGFGFTPHKFDPSGTRAARRQARRAHEYATDSSASVPAADHWQPARAMLIWRDGCDKLDGQPDGPSGEPPLFTWSETAKEIVLRAATRKEARSTDAKLEITKASAHVSVGGVPTFWSGGLTGRVTPASCRCEVLLAPGEAYSTLQLTLAKADCRLWRAPFPELLGPIDKCESNQRLPRRDELQYGGWELLQKSETWEVKLPLKDLPHARLERDHLRLAVAPDSFSFHIAGQEDAPILAAETVAGIDPKACSWRLGKKRHDGTQALVDVELTLGKSPGSYWGHELIKIWLV